MKKNKIRSLLIGAALVSAFAVSGCGASGGSSSNSSKEAVVTNDKVVKPPITISPMAPIPVQGVGHKFNTRINNSDKKDYTLKSINVIDPVSGKDLTDDSIVVDYKMCNTIMSNKFCYIDITPSINIDKSSAFIIRATFSSNGSKDEIANQMIRIDEKITENDGLYFKNDIHEIIADNNGRYSMSLPVVLGQDFASIKVTNGTLICDSQNRTKGSACTYILDGKISSDNTLVATNLILQGDKAAKNTDSNTNTDIVLRSNTLVRSGDKEYSYLLLSQPQDIKASTDGSYTKSTITAFNIGNKNAKSFIINAGNGFSVNHKCGTELVTQGSCTTEVDLLPNSTQINLSGVITFSYDDVSTFANIFYNASALNVGLTVTPRGELTNTIIGLDKKVTYIIKNTGGFDLNNVAIKISGNADDFKLDNDSCNGTLEPSKQCFVELTYSPEKTQNRAKIDLGVTANYEDSNQNKMTIYSGTAISYSAVEASNLLTLNPDLHDFVAKTNDGNDTRIYTIKNVGNYTVSFDALTFDKDNNDFNVINNSCLDKKSLEGVGSTCVIQAKFTPSYDYTNEIIKMTLPVNILGVTKAIKSTPLILKANLNSSLNAISAPYISYTTEIKMLSNNNDSTFGDITNNMINFLMLSSRSVSVTYTFSNEVGVGVASSFNVATAKLPVQFEVDNDKTTCSINNEYKPLAAGSDCSVVIIIPKKTAFNDGALISLMGSLSLEYSYLDLNSMERVKVDTENVNVNITRNPISKLDIKATVFEENGDNYISLSWDAANATELPTGKSNIYYITVASPDKFDPSYTSSSICKLTINEPGLCSKIDKLPAAFDLERPDRKLKVTLTHSEDSSYKQTYNVPLTLPQPSQNK